MELNQAILGVLSRWTLADLLNRPHPTASLDPYGRCWLAGSPAPGETGSARSDGAGGKSARLEEEASSRATGREKGQAPFVRRPTLRVVPASGPSREKVPVPFSGPFSSAGCLTRRETEFMT